ncbi:hypothetical protein CH263_08335 [Rhodococcus sp. 06-1059B-a]|nr:restriction endonuclease [Rhodococcus sp. 06-1059B-a]OZD68897.1 hypothetical protein CH263_08335 [Rhodococcus sp. 06-1059B-a]
MSLIEWTRLPGESVEDVVAMLLCSENFEATQVRPGRGDGGIDVFVPTAPNFARRDVYQVKKYAQNLSSSQQRKISRSLDEVVKTAKAQGWTITSWWLVLPLNPTPGNIAWFTKMTKDLPFETHWVGLNRIEFLAATYPQVVDYYLRDGRERLQDQTNRLVGLLTGRRDRSGSEAMAPIDIIDDVRDVYRLINQHDPFYRYEISLTAEPPRPTIAESSPPGLVAIAGYGSDDGWVNVSIIARSLAALEKSPLSGALAIAIEGDNSTLAEFRKFVEYGTPVSLPAGFAKVKLDLPGGLGGDQLDALVSLTPATSGLEGVAERELIIAMLSAEGNPLAELELRLTEVTEGLEGGRRTVWVDAAGFVQLEMLAMQYPDITFNFTISVDAGGKRPGEIVDSLQFLANLHGSNNIGLAQAFGPRKFTVGTINSEREQDPDFRRFAKLAEALRGLQDHTSDRLLFPTTFTGEQALAILEANKLMSGESVTATWTGFKVDRDQNSDPSDWIAFGVGDEADLRLSREIEIELDGQLHVVGKQAALMRGLVSEATAESVRFIPASEDSATLVRFDGEADVGRVHSRRTNLSAANDPDSTAE